MQRFTNFSQNKAKNHCGKVLKVTDKIFHIKMQVWSILNTVWERAKQYAEVYILKKNLLYNSEYVLNISQYNASTFAEST